MKTEVDIQVKRALMDLVTNDRQGEIANLITSGGFRSNKDSRAGTMSISRMKRSTLVNKGHEHTKAIRGFNAEDDIINASRGGNAVPSGNDNIIPPVLYKIAQDYSQTMSGYAGIEAPPTVIAEDFDFKVEVDNLDDILRTDMATRIPGAVKETSQQGSHAVNISIKEQLLSKGIPFTNNRKSITGQDPLFKAVLANKRDAKIAEEEKFDAMITDSNSFSINTTVDAADKFDASTSTPVLQLKQLRNQVQLQCGFFPNVMICDQNTWTALQENPSVLNRVSNNVAANENDLRFVKLMALAILFELDAIYVTSSVRNDSKQNATTQTHQRVGGNQALMCYYPMTTMLLPTDVSWSIRSVLMPMDAMGTFDEEGHASRLWIQNQTNENNADIQMWNSHDVLNPLLAGRLVNTHS